jgi:hypothetical protein
MTNQTIILKVKKAEAKELAAQFNLDVAGLDKDQILGEITEYTLRNWTKKEIKAYAKELKLQDVTDAFDFGYELADQGKVLVPAELPAAPTTEWDEYQTAQAAAPAKTDEELVDEMTTDHTGRNIAIGAAVVGGAAVALTGMFLGACMSAGSTGNGKAAGFRYNGHTAGRKNTVGCF